MHLSSLDSTIIEEVIDTMTPINDEVFAHVSNIAKRNIFYAGWEGIAIADTFAIGFGALMMVVIVKGR